jgi:flavin-dependent dehydrogenase
LTESFDVAVAGAGPAGSVLALRLAQFGKRVVMIEKTRAFGRRPGESLTPGILPLLDAAGIRERLEAAGCLSPRSARILWAGKSRREDASGFIVDRRKFDALLMDAAVEAGVHLIRPARIVACSFERAWLLHVGDCRRIAAGFLADAAGRSRVLPGRKIQCGARTFALCGYWTDACASIHDTVVEAGPSAWYWGAPLDDGSFSAMAFVDASAARTQQYPTLVEASSVLAPFLRNARCIQQRVCDATPFLDAAPVDEHSIKVGDAAVSIDPLSSQGVQTAIGTALHAAAAINTILDRPHDRDLATRFYRQRLAQSADFHSTAAAGFYREQFDACPTDFWRARSNWPARPALMARRRNLGTPSPGTNVRVSPRVRFIRHGASDGCHIFPEDAVELDGNAVAYVDGMKLRDLLEHLSGPGGVHELIARWTPHVPIEKAHQVFRWAWAEGWIEAADDTRAQKSDKLEQVS